MRVISGKYKNIKLVAPKDNNTRPTTDRVKENLFNLIQMEIKDTVVLDLFAGSGGIGIEFASRGAKKIFFNDISYSSVELIKENIARVKLNQAYDVTNFDYQQAIKTTSIQFDYIYLDPPYNKFNYDKIIELIINKNILKNNGKIIIETNQVVTSTLVNIYKTKKYGYNYIYIMQLKK